MARTRPDPVQVPGAGGVTVVDVDDFFESNSGLILLDGIKGIVSEFRATLFAVVGKCRQDFLDDVLESRRDWLELAPHGWMHTTARECEHWGRGQCREYLDTIETTWRRDYYVRGFKAPGWMISNPMYDELLERGWWVADQRYNDDRRPANLRAYVLDGGVEAGRFHYHVQDVCGNGLAESFHQITQLQGPFSFISEVMGDA